MGLFSRDPDDDEADDGGSPFEGRGFILSAIVVGAVVVCGVALLVVTRDRGTPAATPTNPPSAVVTKVPTTEPTGPATPDPTQPSQSGSPRPTKSDGPQACKLPPNDEGLGEAPAGVSWDFDNGVLVPVRDTLGPGITDADGLKRCFRRSPAGAVVAVLTTAAQLQDPRHYVGVVQRRVAPGPGQPLMLAEARRRLVSPSPDDDRNELGQLQYVGYKFIDYTPNRAIMNVAVQIGPGTSDCDRQSCVGAVSIAVRWSGGDWKLDLRPDGALSPEPEVLASLDSYVRFRGGVMIPLCGLFSLMSCLRDIVEGVVSFIFSGVWDLLEEAMKIVMTAAVKFIVATVGTIWIKVPTIPVAHEQNGRFVPTDAVNFMQGRVMWLAMAVATVAVIIAGMKMAYSQRGEGLREVLKSLATFMIVTLFGLAVTTLLVRIGDGLADQFIQDATRTKSFDQRMNDLVNGPYQDLTLPLILLLGFAMIVSSIIQIGLMFVRNGMLILLVGALPLAAAATNTEMGKAWFRKLIGWLAAFVAYKPVAALIYAAAFRLFSDDTGGLSGMVRVTTGVTMMVMALVAMPALIRFVSPKAA